MPCLLIPREINSVCTAISNLFGPREIYFLAGLIFHYMSFSLAQPSPALSPYVKHFWALDDCISLQQPHIQRIVPNGLMELIFYFGDRPRLLSGGASLPDSCMLSGQQRGFYDIAVSGRLSLFAVSLLPFGAKQLFNIPSNEFLDKNIPARLFLKNDADRLEDSLFEAANFQSRVNVIESFLKKQLEKYGKQHDSDRILASIQLLNQRHGIVGLDELSNLACLCRKQFERRFLSDVGASPKQFLRTVRFQNALREKQNCRTQSLTQLAYNCGYFDQSHMIRDFKQLAGLTPAQYFAQCEPFSDYF